jgi:hypothetical protein
VHVQNSCINEAVFAAAIRKEKAAKNSSLGYDPAAYDTKKAPLGGD